MSIYLFFFFLSLNAAFGYFLLSYLVCDKINKSAFDSIHRPNSHWCLLDDRYATMKHFWNIFMHRIQTDYWVSTKDILLSSFYDWMVVQFIFIFFMNASGNVSCFEKSKSYSLNWTLFMCSLFVYFNKLYKESWIEQHSFGSIKCNKFVTKKNCGTLMVKIYAIIK